jgi:hypothetical protein
VCLDQLTFVFLINFLHRIMSVLVPFLQYPQILFYLVAMTTLSECMIPGLGLQFSVWIMVLQLKVFFSSQQVVFSCQQVCDYILVYKVNFVNVKTFLFSSMYCHSTNVFLPQLYAVCTTEIQFIVVKKELFHSNCHVWHTIFLSY